MGGSSKGTTTSSYKPPPEILDAYKRAVQMAGNAASTPFTPYKGEMVAGLNPTQVAAIQNINNAQGMSLPYMGAATQMAQKAAYNYDPSRVGEYMSPYLQNVAQATQANILEQNAQQQQALKSGALQAGAFGGDRSGIAMGEMARQQGLAGAQTMSELYNTGYNNALQSMQQQTQNLFAGSQQMAGLGGAALQQALQGAQAQMAAGGIQQTTQQAYDQAQYNQFLQQQAYPFQLAQFFANIAEGIGAGAGGTSTTTAPGPDPASMILGGLGSIASIWQASDERVKEDIEPVGKTYDGQNIYKFRYKGSPQTQMGLMAQEVEHKHPESVREFGGLKAVDYDKATKEAASMGGVVHPSMERQHFASGGLGMVPYEDFAEGYGGLSYVPQPVKFRGDPNIPKAPEPYTEKGLSSAWDEIKGMNKEQLAALKAGLGKIYSNVENYFTPDMISHASVLDFSSGGLARGHYENGGAPINIVPEDDTQTETPPPTGLGLFLDRVYKNEGPGINKRDISPTGEVGTLRGHYQSDFGKPFSEVTKEDVDALNKRWWDKVKAGDVEAKYGPKVAAAYADLSMTNPTAARKALEASGGDPDKFLGGMSEFYQKLAADKPEKFGVNLKGWLNRVNSWKDIGDFSANYDAKSNAVITPTADDSNAAAAHAGVALAQSQGKEEFGSPKHQRNLIETVLNRDLSDNAKQAILAASLALMGGRSPWLGVNLGEAGRVGMAMYYNTMAQERETMTKAAEAQQNLASAESLRAGVLKTQFQEILPSLYNLYMRVVSDAQARNEQPIPWDQFLKEQGLEGRGLESYKPYVPANIDTGAGAGAGAGSAAGEASGAKTEPATPPNIVAPSEGATPSEQADQSEQKPSDTIKPEIQSYDIPNTAYSNNPGRLMQSQNPADKDRAKALIDQGYTFDVYGKKIDFYGGPQIKQATDAAVKTTDTYNSAYDANRRTQNIVNNISDILAKEGSGAMSDIKGRMAGVAMAFNAADQDTVNRATASDLLNKFYAQLALSSDLQGAPSTAGIDKIKEVERGTGSQNLSPTASREIVGNVRGNLEWQRDMIADWQNLVRKYPATALTADMQNKFHAQWAALLPKYIEQGMANTPVANEIDWKNPNLKKSQFHVGYKYVMPDGRIKIFTGKKEDKFFVEAGQ